MSEEIELLVEALKNAHRVIRSLRVSLDDLEAAISQGTTFEVAFSDVKRDFLDYAREYEIPRFYASWEAAAKLLKEKEKGMPINEAIDALILGNKVRRKSWPSDTWLERVDTKFVARVYDHSLGSSFDQPVCIESADLAATDWEVVE